MWFFLLNLILAFWISNDAKSRMNNQIWWPAATVCLGLFVLPLYFAKRNLKKGETRVGGTIWNVARYFCFIWTIAMYFLGAAELLGFTATPPKNLMESYGSAMFTFSIWFIALLPALFIGFFFKKSGVKEEGPTGPLVRDAPAMATPRESNQGRGG